MKIPAMIDFGLTEREILIREDLNVPIRDGTVVSDARIRADLSTLRLAAGAGARMIVMSHLGCPKEGELNPAFSLLFPCHSETSCS